MNRVRQSAQARKRRLHAASEFCMQVRRGERKKEKEKKGRGHKRKKGHRKEREAREKKEEKKEN